MNFLKKSIAKIYRSSKYTRFKWSDKHVVEKDFFSIYKTANQYTVTSAEKMYALYKATLYVAENNIPGDIVECGVYEGGSTMLCALTLSQLKHTEKSIYLYDTFEGLPEPKEIDISPNNKSAKKTWEKSKSEKGSDWCYSPIEKVEKVMNSTGYNPEKFIYVKGKVEDTIPQTVPNAISLLRLDTDWYESTYHELVHLFPLLSPNGVIIIDDYGHWQGARKAVDEYFGENNIKIFLNRIDYAGRLGIKT